MDAGQNCFSFYKNFFTWPVMKVRASHGMCPSAKNIFKLSSALSRSESLNSYCRMNNRQWQINTQSLRENILNRTLAYENSKILYQQDSLPLPTYIAKCTLSWNIMFKILFTNVYRQHFVSWATKKESCTQLSCTLFKPLPWYSNQEDQTSFFPEWLHERSIFRIPVYAMLHQELETHKEKRSKNSKTFRANLITCKVIT